MICRTYVAFGKKLLDLIPIHILKDLFRRILQTIFQVYEIQVMILEELLLTDGFLTGRLSPFA